MRGAVLLTTSFLLFTSAAAYYVNVANSTPTDEQNYYGYQHSSTANLNAVKSPDSSSIASDESLTPLVNNLQHSVPAFFHGLNSTNPEKSPQFLPDKRRGDRRRARKKSEDENRDQNITVVDTEVNATSWRIARVSGMRVEGEQVSYDNGVPMIIAKEEASIRLFGEGFTNSTMIYFTNYIRPRGEACGHLNASNTYPVSIDSPEADSVLIKVKFSITEHEAIYSLCVGENDTDLAWIHQGVEEYLQIKVYKRLLPFWLQCVLISFLLLLSGLFAGLTLGLLALDRTDLKILANTGSEKERVYAKTIIPLRTRGNYLLCSLVLGNVLVNSTLTILLDDLTSGLIAVITSTTGIVIFGEIIPQAICSRNGLAIGAKTVWITKFLMFVTFPLSYTISFVLDKILGEEIGIVYNREKLKELITVTIEHNDLETDEVNIISGALTLKKKTVEDVMTPLENIFMLSAQDVLDLELVNEIRKRGFARIPIYDCERSRIVSVLNTKDLVFVDSNEKVQLKTLVERHNNTCFFVFSDATLDIMFNAFKTGNRGHMAFVQRLNTGQEDKDPYCETIGLVTLEDILMDWWPDRF